MNNIGVILGRFNPVTVGHAKLFKKALAENKDGAYVVLIKGIDTGADKSRNPLDTKTQAELIHNLVPGINVMESSGASLQDIVYEILEPAADTLYLGDEQYHFIFYCGSDRYQEYKHQADIPEYMRDVIDDLEELGIEVEHIAVEVKMVDREENDGVFDEKKIKYSGPPTDAEIAMYSASAVRNAIARGNDRLAKRILGLEDNDHLYQKVARMVAKGVMSRKVDEKIQYILESLEK